MANLIPQYFKVEHEHSLTLNEDESPRQID